MQSVVPYCNHMSCLESRRLEKSWKTAMPLVLLLGISDGQVPVRGVRKIERTEQENWAKGSDQNNCPLWMPSLSDYNFYLWNASWPQQSNAKCLMLKKYKHPF